MNSCRDDGHTKITASVWETTSYSELNVTWREVSKVETRIRSADKFSKRQVKDRSADEL